MNLLHQLSAWPAVSILLLLLTPAALAGSVLDDLVADALVNNPAIQAAHQAVRRKLAEFEETRGFLDPRLVASAGGSRRTRDVPGSSGFPSITGDSAVLRGGLEIPLKPGAYLAVGAAERYMIEPDDDYDGLYQTLIGAQLRIPLLRDRGFAQWGCRQARALAEYHEARSDLLAVEQTVRHQVEIAYIAAQEMLAMLGIARAATSRFEALLNEARDLAGLKVVPEYQILPAQMELELQREEELRTKQAYHVTLIRLGELIGDGRELDLAGGTRVLVEWARAVRVPQAYSLQQIQAAHGVYRRACYRLEAAQAQWRQALDDSRSELSVNISSTWQGEDADSPMGGGRVLSDDHAGGAIMLLWQRPMGFTAEHGRIAGASALVAEREREREKVALTLSSNLQIACAELSETRERLDLASRAVQAAERSLEAERERFRLGEGRSRFALDAQKDLTAATQRQARVAAALLRAKSSFRFATGYSVQDDVSIPESIQERE